MACYHPLFAWRTSHVLTPTGKPKIHFMRDIKDVSQADYIINNAKSMYPDAELLQLPCGQCIGCRLDYGNEWAIRCMLESTKYQFNYFVTLTYDDEHLPTDFAVDRTTGEVLDERLAHSVVAKDHERFLHDLRQYYKYNYAHDGIRYYMSAEYGSKNGRPHYHYIFFNLPLFDLEFYRRNGDDDIYWTSKTLDKIWKKGFVVIGRVTFSSASYVARYMTKKLKGKSKIEYEKHGIDPVFSRSSTKPGIARDYYDHHRDKIYDLDHLYIAQKDGSPKICKPPKYFDRLFDGFDTDRLNRIKQQRKDVASASLQSALSNTDKSEYEYLAVREDNASRNVLLRPL